MFWVKIKHLNKRFVEEKNAVLSRSKKVIAQVCLQAVIESVCNHAKQRNFKILPKIQTFLVGNTPGDLNFMERGCRKPTQCTS